MWFDSKLIEWGGTGRQYRCEQAEEGKAATGDPWTTQGVEVETKFSFRIQPKLIPFQNPCNEEGLGGNQQGV